jgi:Spy/CpxP family protein refolding chaperone
MIVDQVGLSEVQKEQVDSIVGFYRGQMRALHEEFDEAYMTRYRELNQQARDEVRAVLTEEQRMAYDSLQAEWALRRQERRDSASESGGDRNQP